jgi:hypothetical protein
MKKIFLYSVIFLGFALHSCIEKPVYPSTPVIAYKDFIRYGDPSDPDSVELVVSFTDNEGDIGLAQDDTFGIFSTGNIFMDYMYWDTTGVDHWSYYDNTPADSIPFDTLKIAFRVPPVLPPGDPAEPMKGLIYVKQKAPVNIFPKIKYVVYLYDKARHKSDTIHTPVILF